ncbi:MAG TPA: ABC transporter permease [Candidatus Lokiarchaeia archaeon]|nr:ABC transporter permease [Candidatus Lokiarchaeia archaeon]
MISSDYSNLVIDNSTVEGSIECRYTSTLRLRNSTIPLTTAWKFDSANLTVTNSSLGAVMEFGIGGEINLIDSQIGVLSCNGAFNSRVYANNTNILTVTDAALPFNMITAPTAFALFGQNASYSTSAHVINLTWIGWDSPIINGFLNLSFQILLDGNLYATINGSGFYNQYSGNYLVTIPNTGNHTISLISIDAKGNNYTTTVNIEVVAYPDFPWTEFWVVTGIIAAALIGIFSFLHVKSKRGYFSNLGVLFKKQVSDNAVKIIIFTLVAAAPGILLRLIFGLMSSVSPLTIDTFRSIISEFYSLFITYFGLLCGIIFGMSTVVKDKSEGTLSWFLSKPVRRWEFLWGKVLANFLMIVLVSISCSVSLVLSGIGFLDSQNLPDLLSIGGYIFITGLMALTVIIAAIMLCSTVFNKIGPVIAIPIIFLYAMPTLLAFVPILTRNELPLLLSFTFYIEQLETSWIYASGGLFGSISTMFGQLLGVNITPLNLTPLQIILALGIISIACFALATIYIQRKDIP